MALGDSLDLRFGARPVTRVPELGCGTASCSAHNSSYAPSTVLRETPSAAASVRVAGSLLPGSYPPVRIWPFKARANCSNSAPCPSSFRIMFWLGSSILIRRQHLSIIPAQLPRGRTLRYPRALTFVPPRSVTADSVLVGLWYLEIVEKWLLRIPMNVPILIPDAWKPGQLGRRPCQAVVSAHFLAVSCAPVNRFANHTNHLAGSFTRQRRRNNPGRPRFGICSFTCARRIVYGGRLFILPSRRRVRDAAGCAPTHCRRAADCAQ